jgi:hypothetical protein
MRKFHDVYKEKQNKAIELFENQVLNDFKNVYSTLLDKYGISDFYALNEEEQVTLLAELNSYWNEDEGVSEKGKKFLQIRSDVLSESSTSLQKKNFFKNKATVIINETIRQSDLKWKLYDIIDEMFNEVQASSVTDVLSPDIISDIIQESVKTTLDNFIKEIRTELNESAKEVDINEAKKNKKDPKADIRNRGDVVFPAGSAKVKDDKDHFPINNAAQARNALARANQYSSSPAWYSGPLDELVKKVAGAVKRKYPTIKVSKAAEKPGKN